MRAISLWEPWGTAIAKGLKKLETRGWVTNYRGPLVIHCAKTREHANFIRDPRVVADFEHVGVKNIHDLAFGHVVATCRLVAVRHTEHIVYEIPGLELALGDYAVGRFAWILEDVTPLPAPIPWKGKQGFFTVPDEVLGIAPSQGRLL